MPVACRNIKRGPLVLTRGKEEEWVFGGSGSKDGSDYQQLPDDIRQDANFLRMTRKGLLAVVTDDEAEEHLALQTEAWQAQQQSHVNTAMGVITREADRDIVTEVNEMGQPTGPSTQQEPTTGIDGTTKRDDMVVTLDDTGGVQYVDSSQPTASDPQVPTEASTNPPPTDFAALVQQAAQQEE